MIAFAHAIQSVQPIDGTYPPSPCGAYLRCVREALGLTVHSAHRVLGIGLHDFSEIEAGRMAFVDRLTWTRAELALIVAAGPGWAGDLPSYLLYSGLVLAARAAVTTDPILRSYRLTQAWANVDLAAKPQIQTVKRGILYRLAGELALEAGPADAESATLLAENGLSDWTTTGPSVGPMPPWLAAGLQAVLDEARAMTPATVTA